MGPVEIMLWVSGAAVITAPFAIWHYGIVGLRFGLVGLALLALATLWKAADDGAAAFVMLIVWLGAFSYVGVFALIAHASGQLHHRSTQ